RPSSTPACTCRRSASPPSHHAARRSAGSARSCSAVPSSSRAVVATGTEDGRWRMTAVSDELIPPLPPSAPRAGHGTFARWLGRSVLRLGGWRVVGSLPDVPKLVIIAAPHSSNWDGIWGFAAKLALGFDVRILGKAELFWWPLG